MSALRAELVCKKLKGMHFDLKALHSLAEDSQHPIIEDEERMTHLRHFQATSKQDLHL
jgi:hypothetical protein